MLMLMKFTIQFLQELKPNHLDKYYYGGAPAGPEEMVKQKKIWEGH